MPGQLCFVLMPFGQKPDAGGAVIDFDAVYRDVIAPAIRDADMEPLRADEEVTGGIIHKAMFERLILCEYAVADLTTANANVFYELGVRHAVRPWSTVALFAKGSRLPFDVTMLRAIPYTLTPAGTPDDIDATRKSLTAQLSDARKAIKDSPVFTLIEDMSEQQIDREKTDAFRDRVSYSQHLKDRLAAARQRGGAAVQAVESELGNIADAESGVVIDLFLSYRAMRAWGDMIRLVERMSPPLAATVMVQEQLALALNRAGDGAQAETVLTRLLEKRGPSSETYGILGRVYKDRWEEASKDSRPPYLARGLLDKAIDAYVRGFEADWRDAYPGINAVTLMELRDQPDPRQQQLLPVVAYAVERRIAAGKPDYWDHATRLELAVLARDEAKAESALANALAAVREPWEPETTVRNLRLIREAREQRHTSTPWATQMEEVLLERSKA
jgi:tetratricopeptide (TPR) repeat protein